MAPPIRWFYVAEGRRQGPVELSRLVELILSGTVPDDALVWYAGQPDWVPARRIAEIAKELPPPLPTAQPASAGELAIGTALATEAPPAVLTAAAAPGAEGATASAGEGRHEHRHRHRHKRHRYVVITSPWWRRWMIPFLLALVALGLFLWLYLMHINQPAPPEVFAEPAAAVVGPLPACG